MLKKVVVDNDPITPAQAAEELTSRERAWLMQSDPVTCASYFDYRFRELKKTWTAPCADGPFLGLNVQE
ncbi:hypothetical protein G6F42_026973 [Rhizopus arrhizus]|nr:hypothetical protein G6F42_026973 [Rhizopus arrhizus]